MLVLSVKITQNKKGHQQVGIASPVGLRKERLKEIQLQGARDARTRSLVIMRGIRVVWLGQQSGRSQEIGEKSKLVVRYQETGEYNRLVILLLEELNVKWHRTELWNRRELGQGERKMKKKSC
jgi:hypothetical protein